MKRRFPILFVCLLLTGCGTYGTVKGTVSYKGKKLDSGTVTGLAANGSFSSDIDAEGKYEIKGMAAGKVKFCVSQPNPKTAEVAQVLLKDKDSGGKQGAGRGPKTIQKKDLTPAQLEAMSHPQLIPEKYTDTAQPLLTFDLKGGDNNFDITLTD